MRVFKQHIIHLVIQELDSVRGIAVVARLHIALNGDWLSVLVQNRCL
jgi:hypothetical protein